ncbi:MAG TPA: methionine/alanine import family NSS transporter small subunit, partial [Candidatus Nanopelagicales bacterium]|nr:methionine/alanine import family NSS transporter small subunit [Candidatus Nanopelagicales bacterium]
AEHSPGSAAGTRATRRGAALMSTGAILMMLFAMLVLWGGLGLAIYNLTRRSKAPEEHYYRDL